MENYTTLSLETHLFFARIMKEHALFLMAGFPCKEERWIERGDWFRQQFEDLLRDTVQISDKRVNQEVLHSGELTTEFTIPAENRTQQLSGIAIDSDISRQTKQLNAVCEMTEDREVIRGINSLNRRAMRLLDDFIAFKESILEAVGRGRLFQANYPLLIDHILREAKLYRATVRELMGNRNPSYKNLRRTEEFWNQIMMEHAWFIRGLLDPCEKELIQTAEGFAEDYCALLEKARQQDCRANRTTEETLAKTKEYCQFKAAGTKGILDCKIASIILPLLADHVLREANHYIRLLETGNVK